MTQTVGQVAAVGGAFGTIGSIHVRDAQFVWRDPVAGNAVYEPGDDAPIQVTIVNDATSTVADGQAPDRLAAVSSPIAASGRIVGAARIPDGQVLTAGYAKPAAAVDLPGTAEVSIALVGLTEPIRVGRTYPVDFVFERAGRLRIALPVENPAFEPSQAGVGTAVHDAGSTPSGVAEGSR